MLRFEEVRDDWKKFPEIETKLPERSTLKAAAYDFFSKEDFTIPSGDFYTTWTDIRANMPDGVVLQMYTRSGMGVKYGVVLRNNVGIIDADYYGNAKNDGNIAVCLWNTGKNEYVVHKGDRIAQGIFTSFLIADDENKPTATRDFGFGSTGK